jgi:hypothetical protein
VFFSIIDQFNNDDDKTQDVAVRIITFAKTHLGALEWEICTKLRSLVSSRSDSRKKVVVEKREN